MKSKIEYLYMPSRVYSIGVDHINVRITLGAPM